MEMKTTIKLVPWFYSLAQYARGLRQTKELFLALLLVLDMKMIEKGDCSALFLA
jgi:hypothetical protein